MNAYLRSFFSTAIRGWIKPISVIVLFSVGLYSFAYANPDSIPFVSFLNPPLTKIRLPADIGVTAGTFQAVHSHKTVLLVDGGDGSPRSERTLARTLEYLASRYRIKTVYVEGGSGDVSLDMFRGVPQDRRRRVGETYLRRGLVSGAEFDNLTAPDAFTLWGIDDPTLYDSALKSYGPIAARQKAAHECLAALDRSLTDLKKKSYKGALRTVDQKRSLYRAGKISLASYVSALRKAPVAMPDFEVSFPHLAGLSEPGRQEIAQKELGTLEALVFVSLATGDQENLWETDLKLSFLRDYIDLRSGSAEFEAYQDNPKAYDPWAIHQALVKSSRKAGLSPRRIGDLGPLEDVLTRLTDYYKLEEERDMSFRNRVLERMNGRREKNAIVVTRGPNLSRLNELLRQDSVDYFDIRPSFRPSGTGVEAKRVIAPKGIIARLPMEIAADKTPLFCRLAADLGLLPEEWLLMLQDALKPSVVNEIRRLSAGAPHFSWVAPPDNAPSFERLLEIERMFDADKYSAFKIFTDAKKPAGSDDALEAKLIETRLRAYENALRLASSRAEIRRLGVFAGFRANLKSAQKTVIPTYLTASFLSIFSPVAAQVAWLSAALNKPAAPQFQPSDVEQEETLAFLRSNLTAEGMPLSYLAPRDYWKRTESTMTDVDSVLERLLVTHSLSIYDAAVWQAALIHFGNADDAALVDAHTDRLISGRSGTLDDIRADGDLFKYGDERKVLKKDNAYFFRIIADRYLQDDPLTGKVGPHGFPNFNLLHHEDWKPITGEQAWAAIIGPLQTAYVKYHGHIPVNSKEVKLALDSLPGIEAMQSPIGAIYHAPDGTFGKNPHDISNENNFSMYAALRMLYDVVKASDPASAHRIHRLLTGQEDYFAKYAFDADSGVFYQGGFFIDGRFIPTRIFAVDCQTWGSAVLGPAWLDRHFGKGTAFRLWERTLERAGYVDQDGIVRGVGFSDGHRVMSVEWTCGAILCAREMEKYYRASETLWARKLRLDAESMRYGIEDCSKILQNGSRAYFYSNRRTFIPFGWWANPIPNLVSSAWVLLTDHHFNPFILGGGPDFSASENAS